MLFGFWLFKQSTGYRDSKEKYYFDFFWLFFPQERNPFIYLFILFCGVGATVPLVLCGEYK